MIWQTKGEQLERVSKPFKMNKNSVEGGVDGDEYEVDEDDGVIVQSAFVLEVRIGGKTKSSVLDPLLGFISYFKNTSVQFSISLLSFGNSLKSQY